MSILEDYDHDYIPPCKDDNDLEDQASEIDTLNDEIDMLSKTIASLETFGITQSSLALMQTTGLVSGTVLDAVAVEAFENRPPDHPETHMATEALLDKIKAKMANLSARVLTFFKDTGSKITSIIKSLIEKVKATIVTTNLKVFDNVDTAKNFVKAHPCKSVVLASAAALGVFGIVNLVVKSMPSYKDRDKLPEFMTKFKNQIAGIHWPFGEIKTAVSAAGNKISITIPKIPKVAGIATITALGWTKNMVSGISNTISRAATGVSNNWDSIQDRSVKIVSDGWTMTKGVVTGAVNGASLGVNSVPAEYHGVPGALARLGIGAVFGAVSAFAAAAVSILYVTYHLVKTIVIGTLKLISASLNKLQEGSPERTQYV